MIVRSNLTKQGCKSLNQDKKSLKTQTGQSEAVNQRTDNTMDKRYQRGIIICKSKDRQYNGQKIPKGYQNL
jgi:hypothetical protein